MSSKIKLEIKDEDDNLPPEKTPKLEIKNEIFDTEGSPDIKFEIKTEIKSEIKTEFKAEINEEVFNFIPQCIDKCRELLKPCSDCLIFKARRMVKTIQESKFSSSYHSMTLNVNFVIDDLPESTNTVEILKLGNNPEVNIIEYFTNVISGNQISITFLLTNERKLLETTYDDLAETFLCHIPDESTIRNFGGYFLQFLEILSNSVQKVINREIACLPLVNRQNSHVGRKSCHFW